MENAHARSVEEVLDELATSREGLSSQEAVRRLDDAGPNKLPDAQRDNVLKRFFKHFNDVLIYILLVAVVVTALLGHWVDSGVILGVVVIIALVGFIQEGKAEAALEGIRAMLTLEAQARRDGRWEAIPAEDLVPGDVVRLRSGDRVPADVRIIERTNLSIEESALTGESQPVKKSTEPAEEDAGVGDRPSMAFSSSLVTSGRGVGVVTGTGVNTEIGRISTLTSEVETLATPLTRAMNRFGKQLSVAIVVLAGVVFGIGVLVHGDPAAETLLASISLAVAAVPEGLPAVVTITFAIGAQRMARRNAITRRLDAVETLGSITVICSDKTGTLTKNEMTARAVVTRAGAYDVTGMGYAPDGDIRLDEQPVDLGDRADLQALVEAMSVANDADIIQDQDQWVLNGEPTEGALQTLARKLGYDPSDHDRRAEVPFESEHKLMATLARRPDGDAVVLVKGAPDNLLDRCATELGADGQEHDLDRGWWEERIGELTAGGSRVLAAARRPASPDEADLALGDLDQGLQLLGVVGIVDPPRPEAIEAIAACRTAGITVKMITGDHPDTALAIAREMGIVDPDDDVRAVTGRDLAKADDAELADLARTHHVFARTSPENKLQLVSALQADGDVVAMTGDGVNDAPTLKRADVGVAMGIKGTEATKEAAEIVLADDNFVTIERAVEEGRTIYDNLRKSILFILPTNGAQALVIVTAVLLGFTLPLTPTQILWVNMVTAVTLALSLAFEDAEPGIMRRRPRDPDASILDGYFAWRISLVTVLIGGGTIGVFLLADVDVVGLDVARTVAVSTLVVAQIFYLFNSRFLTAASYHPSRLLGNRIAWIAVGALVVLQLVFVYAPFMNTLFGTAPLQLHHWGITLLVGLGVFVLVEIEKAVVRARSLIKS
ncbi:cation-transporting P-type ATPase [Cellulomonas bogoriensis]|uniref:Carbonate dehydratase n=1 Tax=Cellulomonas bogoriensis 69B4 = DSM 16987 TaxID=1386082 RepID=A0A0A0BL66_9CELL|nr:cation-transporting P-type ATPase [Cellulomonas bogoriensis]KGM09228.1 carbonate dehydratase [Cellulomonas bogoriensis 69B4 = DSM 16987]